MLQTISNEDGVIDPQCAFIRRSQLSFVKDFVVRKAEASSSPDEPIVVAGDFEVDARSGMAEGQVDSVDYLEMMDILTGHDGNSERVAFEDPIRDVAGQHPVTFGDVREEGGQLVPTDTTLTHKLDQCTRQR